MEYILLAFAYYAAEELEEAAWNNEYPSHWSSWWNKERSWPNKHKWGIAVAEKLGFGKRFFKLAFTTSLVVVTDAEHFFQFCKMIVLATLVYVSAGGWALLLFLIGYYAGGTLKTAIKAAGIRILR